MYPKQQSEWPNLQTLIGFEDVPKGLVKFFLVFSCDANFHFYFWGQML
jgi:hypothetical protein